MDNRGVVGELQRGFIPEGEDDHIPGASYHSCLQWYAHKNSYVFFTVWSENEAVNFVNSLIQVEEGKQAK